MRVTPWISSQFQKKNQIRVTRWISSQSDTRCESLAGFSANFKMRVTPWISSQFKQKKTRFESLDGFPVNQIPDASHSLDFQPIWKCESLPGFPVNLNKKDQIRVTPWIFSQSDTRCESLAWFSANLKMRVTPWFSSQFKQKKDQIRVTPWISSQFKQKKPDSSHSLDFQSINYQMRLTHWIVNLIRKYAFE